MEAAGAVDVLRSNRAADAPAHPLAVIGAAPGSAGSGLRLSGQIGGPVDLLRSALCRWTGSCRQRGVRISRFLCLTSI